MRNSPRALWFPGREQAEIRETQTPPFASGFCEIETLYSAVSAGTEGLVFRGEVPPSLHDQMRCPHMEGSFNFPIKYGYSIAGRVIRGENPAPGTLVHALHPHQDFICLPETDVTPIPEHIPPRRAVLASNLETAVNAVWDSRMSLGDDVLVTGFGLIGALIARLSGDIPGTRITITDEREEKRALAEKLGFRALPPEDLNTGGESFDIAFHASGHESGLQTCIDRVRFEGRVMELSWYGSRSVDIKLGGDFHSARKSIIASQVSNLPANRRASWDFHRRKDLVFRLLRDDWFDEVITRELVFQELPEFFRELRDHPGRELGIVARYQGGRAES